MSDNSSPGPWSLTQTVSSKGKKIHILDANGDEVATINTAGEMANDAWGNAKLIMKALESIGYP